jgi:hypothetical protein
MTLIERTKAPTPEGYQRRQWELTEEAEVTNVEPVAAAQPSGKVAA